MTTMNTRGDRGQKPQRQFTKSTAKPSVCTKPEDEEAVEKRETGRETEPTGEKELGEEILTLLRPH